MIVPSLVSVQTPLLPSLLMTMLHSTVMSCPIVRSPTIKNPFVLLLFSFIAPDSSVMESVCIVPLVARICAVSWLSSIVRFSAYRSISFQIVIKLLSPWLPVIETFFIVAFMTPVSKNRLVPSMLIFNLLFLIVTSVRQTSLPFTERMILSALKFWITMFLRIREPFSPLLSTPLKTE